MAKTTVRCPKCGTAFEIPVQEILGIVGNLIGENSGLGDVYLKPKEGEPKKPLRDSCGRFTGNKCGDVPVDVGTNKDDTRLSEKIRDGKPVKNHRLFRRWIMSQVFHALNEIDLCHGHTPFTNIVRRRGIRYMADVIQNEVHDMCVILRNGDMAEYSRRYRWWNIGTIERIGDEFIDILQHEIDRLKVRKCKGRPYKRIPGFGDTFVDEIDERVIVPLRNAVDGIVDGRDNIVDGKGNSFEDRVSRLCNEIRRFKESSAWKIRMPAKFLDCYKGNGAYYTLQNLIQFHDCRLPSDVRVGHEDLVGWHRDLAILEDLADKYRDAGWQLMGLVKDTISANGIDVAKKIASWSK